MFEMKKLLIWAGVSLLCSSSALAQGYAGALLGVAHYSGICSQGSDCDKSSSSYRVFAGMKLAPERSLKLGPIAVDAFEFGYTRFGRHDETVPDGALVYDPDWTDEDLQYLPVDVRQRVRVDALTAAAVAHWPVASTFRLAGRVGVAYVSAEGAENVEGTSNAATTRNSLQPYGGLGIEFDVTKWATLSAVYDVVRFKVGSDSGQVSFIGLGAQASF